MNAFVSLVSRRWLGGSLVRAGAFLALAVGGCEEVWAEKPLMAYVGTFTSPLKDVLPTQVDLPPGNGRGIHCFEVDRTSGGLRPVEVIEMGTSPNAFAIHPSGWLYSTNETDRQGEAGEGTVSAFAIHPETGRLRLLNTVRSGGAGPTHASLHPSGRFLFVANYFGGSVAVLPVHKDGTLGEATDVKNDSGDIGPRVAKNAPPGSFAFSGHDRTHAHMIQSDPSGRFVYHTDLGLDRIYSWRFDPSRGKLQPNDPPFVELPPGDGPRHFAFHPGGRWMYSLQEEGSTVVVFAWDAERGALKEVQTISSLPPGYAGSNFCSGIVVSADGQQVYVGNRLHDSIGIFGVQPDGQLRFEGEEWTRGNYPRSFNFDPSGRFLYVCNQRADHVSVFRREAGGGLRFTGAYVPVGNPSAISFWEGNGGAAGR
jgi:6-phosphogluconolactonase